MICTREAGADVIYSIGGVNADGYSYKLRLNENPAWEPLEKQYSMLFSSPEAISDRKFMFRSSVNLF
jgi:hypothetical protein